MTSEANFQQCTALMRQGRFDDAERQVQSILATTPDDARALRLHGTICHLTGRSDEARALLEQALGLEPDNVNTLLNLGSVHLDADRLPDAEHCFARAVRCDPEASDGHFNLGLVAQRAGRLDDAERHYQFAVEHDSQAFDALLNLALVHLQQRRYDACMDETARLLAHDAANLHARVTQVDALLRLGRFDEAQTVLTESPLAVSDHLELAAIEAELNFRRGRLSDAVRGYQQATALGDQRLKTALNLARCLIESGQGESAASLLQRSVERFPRVAECHGLLTLALSDAGHIEAALAACERAINLEPQSLEYLTLRARLHFDAGHDAETECSLDAAIAAHPGAVSPQLLKVEHLTRRSDLPGALDTCEAFINKVGPECNMLANSGFLLQALGRGTQASTLMDYDRLIASQVIEPPEGYRDLASFNAALVDEIRVHPSLSQHNAASKATQHGRQSGNLLFTDHGPFATFEHVLWRAVERYLQQHDVDPDHPFLAERPELGEVFCWAVVLERAGYQTPHIHPTAWLSGVYYPQLPALVREGNDQQGWIEFGAPPPELSFQPALATRQMQPTEGLLVLFPSYFYHRTLPYHSDEQRFSMAFDFTPRRRTQTVGTVAGHDQSVSP